MPERVHLVDEHGAPLCPEAELRDAMDDGEFWAHVLQPGQEQGPDYEPEEPDEGDISEWDVEHRLAEPCPECGQLGACSYDAEGRALIHVTPTEETNP
jgi:hypothetical protein